MPKSEKKKSRYISYLLRFAVAGGALYLIFRGENLKQIADVLLGLHLWVFAAALGFYVAGQLIFVARWSLLLRVQSIKIGFWPAVRLHFLGLFYNNCLPGAIGGDLPRAWYVTKHTDKKLEAALSVFVDRAIGLTGMLIMAFGCYWFVPEKSREEGFNFSFDINIVQRISEYRWFVISFVIALTGIFLFFVLNSKGRILLSRGIKYIQRRGLLILNKVRDSIRIYCKKWLAIILALLLTFCCQGMSVIAVLLIGREIGIDVNAKYYFIFFPISWLLGAVPISVGGIGIMEGWLKIMFMRVGTITSDNALALALSQRFIMILASLPGAVIHLIGAHLPKDFFIDYNEPLA